jgi:hypothetical protein
MIIPTVLKQVIIMSKKTLSTFEREMLDPDFKEQFDKEYTEFLLSETVR